MNEASQKSKEYQEYEHLNYHVKWLGKNYKLGDPTHRLIVDADLEAFAREEHSRAEAEGHTQPLISGRALCAFHGYGRNSVWPPVDPGTPIDKLQEKFTLSHDFVQFEWFRLNELVVTKEREIQETIINLTDGKIKDQNGTTLRLQDYLEHSWEVTRASFNVKYVANCAKSGLGYMESDFSLDPEGQINPNHSSDLDVFAQEYLRNVRVNFQSTMNGKPRVFDEKRQYPLYRHAANYHDDRQALEDAIMDDAKVRLLEKPDPETSMEDSEQVSYNFDVEDLLRKKRARFLVSHINQEDLSIPLNLLMFIHYRARLLPIEFVIQDNNRMHLGRQVSILSGACDPWYYTGFFWPADEQYEKQEHKDTIGPKLMPVWSWNGNADPRFKKAQSAGILFGSMEAWLILQSQAITYLFLATFCKEMLDLAKPKEIRDHINEISKEEILEIETSAAERIKMLKGKKGAESMQDIASLRQYEPNSTVLDLETYRTKLKKKCTEAEEHIKKLFDNPIYLTEYIMEQKDHHWTNICEDLSTHLPNEHIQNYPDKDLREVLYRSCMRSVLRRAFFEFFIWDAVNKALEDLATFEQNKFPESPNMKNCRRCRLTITPRSINCTEKVRDLYLTKHRELQELIRHAAAFFVFEFRKEAIHAAYEPMRNIYRTTRKPEYKNEWLIREYYDSEDIMLGFQEQAQDSGREQRHRIVAELIENFISNKHSSMYVGIRKTTAKVKRHIEAYNNDAETKVKFSPLISRTIDGLDLLADVAEHLELVPGVHLQMNEWSKESEEECRKTFSKMLQKFSSYDLLALDNCDFQDQHVPNKRTHRIFRFLDEVQELPLESAQEKSFGKAKGDIKRFGASLLRGLIYPLNNKDHKLRYRRKTWGFQFAKDHGRGTVFPADEKALERLTKCIGITKEQWPFAKNEAILDLEPEATYNPQKTSAEIENPNLKAWISLQKAMSERRRIQREKFKKQREKLKKLKKRYQEEIQPPKSPESNRIVKKDSKGKSPMSARGMHLREQSDELDDTEMKDLDWEDAPTTTSKDGRDDTGDAAQVNVEPEPEPQPQTQSSNTLQEEPFDPRPARQRNISKYRPPAPAPPPRQQPAPDPNMAPDGTPKREVNKHTWETLERLTLREKKFTNSAGKKTSETLPVVTWTDVMSALVDSLGFEHKLPEGGSSHHKFRWNENCLLPKECLEKNFNLNPDGNHKQKVGKMSDWQDNLEDAGITWRVVKDWFKKKET
ncbi:hypothetical protein IL306_014064 [Fusarium sp. DS 682]|nr:hypothetical protein IL306_014064 [Fusarium sp. DS 682]